MQTEFMAFDPLSQLSYVPCAARLLTECRKSVTRYPDLGYLVLFFMFCCSGLLSCTQFFFPL